METDPLGTYQEGLDDVTEIVRAAEMTFKDRRYRIQTLKLHPHNGSGDRFSFEIYRQAHIKVIEIPGVDRQPSGGEITADLWITLHGLDPTLISRSEWDAMNAALDWLSNHFR